LTQIKIAVKQAFDTIDSIISGAALTLRNGNPIQTEGVCRLMPHQIAWKYPTETLILIDLQEDLVFEGLEGSLRSTKLCFELTHYFPLRLVSTLFLKRSHNSSKKGARGLDFSL
jgi:hypothetical protein